MAFLRTLWSAIVVAGVLGVAGFMGHSYLKGEGTIHVAAPYDAAIAVSVDGNEVAKVTAGGNRELKIAQGKHTVTLRTDSKQGREYELDVDSGFYESLLPATDYQCFADLDVKKTYYSGDDPVEMPKLDATFDSAAPIEISSHHYFTEQGLPGSLKESRSANLILQIPCELVGKGRDEVNAALDFVAQK